MCVISWSRLLPKKATACSPLTLLHCVAQGSCEPVTWAEFHPLDAALVTAGKNHLAFWTAHGTTLFKMAAVFDARLRPKFVTAVAFAQSGAAISGDSNGNVTLWARGEPWTHPCYPRTLVLHPKDNFQLGAVQLLSQRFVLITVMLSRNFVISKIFIFNLGSGMATSDFV